MQKRRRKSGCPTFLYHFCKRPSLAKLFWRKRSICRCALLPKSPIKIGSLQKIGGSAVPSLLQRLFFRKNRRAPDRLCPLSLWRARALPFGTQTEVRSGSAGKPYWVPRCRRTLKAFVEACMAVRAVAVLSTAMTQVMHVCLCYWCTYVDVYVCKFTGIYMHICVCMYMYIYMYMCMFICMRTKKKYICIYVYMYTDIYVYMYIHIHMYIYIYVCIICIYGYIYVYICVYVYMYIFRHIVCRDVTHIYIHTYIFTYIHIYINIHIYIYAPPSPLGLLVKTVSVYFMGSLSAANNLASLTSACSAASIACA